MGVKFTTEQNKAIETLDKSILVSAAAGSGKTAVLVQRIINIILSGNANVDEMLVVTFTKAAAAEMRLKLSRAIKQRMKDDPASKAKLRDQLNRLYRSYISTFDSFAVRVIKEFFYEIDIEPNFKACDEVQSELMQREALDSLFEEAFVNGELIAGGSFRSFLRLYSKERSEQSFKDDMLAAYAALRSMPDYWNWAYDRAAELKLNKENIADSRLAESIMADARSELSTAVKSFEEIRELYILNGIEKKFYDMLGKEYEAVTKLKSIADKGAWNNDFADLILNIPWANLQSYTAFFEKGTEDDLKKIYAGFRTEITPLRNLCKDAVANIVNRYFLPDFGTRLSEMNATYEHTIYYLNLMKAFEDRYLQLKKDAGVLDFGDMEHIAVQILEKDVPAETLRKRFKYIFIDEYQDTNNIQEYLIGRFAREDNVFKVGDVKQSIYRFRQAEPAIFERVYREYSSDQDAFSMAIDLNKNFRCNDATINYINVVFGNIMEGYDSRARLYTGLDSGAGYQDEYDFKPEVHVLLKEIAEDEFEADDPAGDEIENLSNEEAEAVYIAKLVRDTIGTTFCDTKTGEIRKATARDIVVLLRATKVRGEVMARALRNVEVQSHIEEDDNYFDTVEIGIALSLFQTIDNSKRDVQLIATLHSEVFGWTPSELANIRIAHRQFLRDHKDEHQGNRKPSFWEALDWYAVNGKDEQLRSKVQYAHSKINEWRELANMMPLDDFVWKVLVDSGYYMYAGAMYDGNRRQANLRVLVDRARQYSEGTVASLSSFLRFIEIMKTKKISNGQASMVSKEDDVVRITTIHKSKGLEYPFVIVGGLGHQFRRDNSEMKLSFDSELGVALPFVSADRRYWRSTVMQRAINAKSNAESYKEELRILYVAMTRARNKLFMVGAVKNEEELNKFTANPNCFLKVMREVLDTPYNDYYVNNLELRRDITKESRVQALLASRPKVLTPEALSMYEEIDRRLSYEYPDAAMLEAPSKYSVSAIRRDELASEAQPGAINADDAPASDATTIDNEVVNLWHLTDNKKKASASDLGIAYHRIMEYIDFTKVVEPGYILESARFLCDNGAIEEEVFKALQFERIADFFRTPLGQRAIRAAISGKLKKEKAFTLSTEWKGRDILVQGVIDCCWEETDTNGNPCMVLVDYKSNYINPRKPKEEEIERIRREYKTQIELYSKAITEGTGLPVGEAYLYLFNTSEAVRIYQ